jgi:hypothetical protein
VGQGLSENWPAPKWANELTKLLDAVYAGSSERFPVRVEDLARDFSHQRFPDDPVTLIRGERLNRFDGGLFKAPAGEKGWGIIYNSAITSPGRKAFTLGHEFGHYLAHRHDHPEGLQCSPQDMVRWDSDYARIEREANAFAATLLMPLHDYRKQIGGKAKPSLDDIGNCATRYGVSLIAAVCQWLNYTERRSILVVSRDGFILWARSSEAALKTRAFFRTKNRPPIPIPASSLAARPEVAASTGAIDHDAGVWLSEPCHELALLSDRYDFAISLLHLGDPPPWRSESDDEFEPDVLDVMNRLNSRR